MLRELGAPALHARLAAEDPATAARLEPNAGQRIARAWEVWRGTGIGLVAWQAQSQQAQSPQAPPCQPQSDPLRAAPTPWRFTAILLDPPRDALRAAIATRFAAMVAEGALDEVRALLAQDLDPALPAMRAHGVPELSAYLRNETTLEEAGRRTELVTGQYTKRQATWFRHHPLSERAHTIHARFAGVAQFSERKIEEIVAFIQSPS